MRLNLGAGDVPVDGYTSMDRKTGHEIYPLKHADGSVDEIRASHVLEHVSHTQTLNVLIDWVRALKPGGLLKVAVPDLDVIYSLYQSESDAPIEGYLMGGHVDADDHHGAIFNYGKLYDLMKAAGLVGIERWTSEVKDCAALPVSLNLQGYKVPDKWPKVGAVMSVPRLGFMDNFFCSYQLPKLGIELRKYSGAFWGQCLTRAIEESLEDGVEYILTVDYDTIFTRDDVQALMLIMMQHPGIDALAPLQASRTKATPLMTIKQDGKNISNVPYETFEPPTTPISTAHFGLTLIRAERLKRLPRPWFAGTPGKDGAWGDDRTDDDIHFWRQWDAAGFSLHLANRVAVGHAELMIRWPGQDLQAIYQHPSEFWGEGKPGGLWK